LDDYGQSYSKDAVPVKSLSFKILKLDYEGLTINKLISQNKLKFVGKKDALRKDFILEYKPDMNCERFRLNSQGQYANYQTISGPVRALSTLLFMQSSKKLNNESNLIFVIVSSFKKGL
jgi:hypothetical protein